MTVLYEGRHAEEFLISEANGTRSRSVGTVKSGQGVLDPGTVVQDDGTGALVKVVGDIDSHGEIDGGVAGVLCRRVDTTGGDVAGQPYIGRDAEVQGAALTYPDESTTGGEQAATDASLAKLGIIVR